MIRTNRSSRRQFLVVPGKAALAIPFLASALPASTSPNTSTARCVKPAACHRDAISNRAP